MCRTNLFYPFRVYFVIVFVSTEISPRFLQWYLLHFRYRLGNAPSPPGSSNEEEGEEEEEEGMGEASNRSSIQDEPKHTPKKQHDGTLYTLIIITLSECSVCN